MGCLALALVDGEPKALHQNLLGDALGHRCVCTAKLADIELDHDQQPNPKCGIRIDLIPSQESAVIGSPCCWWMAE